MAAIGRVLLMPKGAYSGSTVYNALDWVRHDSKAWVCKVDGTVGIVPSEGANWTLLAADGSVSGSVAWLAVTGKPFDDVDSTDFDVDGSNNLIIKRDTFGTMRIVSAGTTTNLEASGDSVFEIDAGTNVTITADDTANPKKITINSTGGGGGSLDDLSDVTITSGTLAPNQILKYNGTKWVNGTGGGHTMIDNSTYLSTMKANSQVPTDDKVASTYAISNWSNAEIVTLYTTIAKDTDTVGKWEDDPTWKNYDPTTDDPTVYRDGWLFHKALYKVISDDEVEIEVVFDIKDSEAVNVYAYRVDDEVYMPYTPSGDPSALGLYELSGGAFVLTTDTTVVSGKTYYIGGGAVAIKLNGPIQNASGVKIGINLKRQRTMVDNLIVI